ncbi:alpha/beta fold hydrolase [Sphingomonas colocasiae]|nr:alpha/beta fold hydrolase [Sphingomonas colocasiae]
MASSPTDFSTHRFASFDGVELAWHEMGAPDARPLVLIHGYFSDAFTNWIRYGHAARIVAEAGRRVIMPDLRAHGQSAKPHDPAAYPADVLAKDGFALIAHLGLTDYDLGGYSLGARTTVRMLAGGAKPGRAIVAGMGLQGLIDTGGRAGHFRHILTNLGSHQRGSPEWMAEAFLKTTKGDPVALLRILDTFVDTPRADIESLHLPVLVLSGVDDDDNGSCEALAATLPDAVARTIPGGHMSAVTRPELGEEIARFLAS